MKNCTELESVRFIQVDQRRPPAYPKAKTEIIWAIKKEANPVEHHYQLETQAMRVTTTSANVGIIAVIWKWKPKSL
jgi:hypothetical protein